MSDTTDPTAAVVASDDDGPRRRSTFALVGWVVLCVVIVVLAIGGGTGALSAPKAVLLGAVEGITEYLPVSSTGHLVVTERIIGLGSGDAKAAADTFAVGVQVGAILAVVLVYRGRIGQLLAGLVGRDDDGRRLLGRLVVAFLPAAVLGAVLGGVIQDHLFQLWPIILAWIVGGVFLLWWKPPAGRVKILELTVRSAFLIGIAQSVAMWPGVSRSLVTIAAALAVGCEMAAAVEFSFLLGFATLTAATVFDLAKDGSTLIDDYGWQMPLLGTLVAFVTATLAVRWMIAYLRTRPMTGFGWYRIGIAAVTIVLVATGVV